MNGAAHRAIGVMSGIAGVATVASTMVTDIPAYEKTPELYGLIIGAAVFGSLLPDIDEPSSTVGKKVKIVSKTLKGSAGHRGMMHAPLMCVLIWFGIKSLEPFVVTGQYHDRAMVISCMVLGVAFLATLIAYRKNRGSIISLGWCIAAAYVLLIRRDIVPLWKSLAIGLPLGYASHLLADFLNRAGIPILWPVTGKKYHLMNLRTNKDEWVALGIFLAASILWVYKLNSTAFLQLRFLQ